MGVNVPPNSFFKILRVSRSVHFAKLNRAVECASVWKWAVLFWARKSNPSEVIEALGGWLPSKRRWAARVGCRQCWSLMPNSKHPFLQPNRVIPTAPCNSCIAMQIYYFIILRFNTSYPYFKASSLQLCTSMRHPVGSMPHNKLTLGL